MISVQLANRAYERGQVSAERYLDYLTSEIIGVLKVLGETGVRALLALALEHDVLNEIITNEITPIPSPLSGEWAGESIPELFGLEVGEDFPDEGELNAYEDNFQHGFWAQIMSVASEV